MPRKMSIPFDGIVEAINKHKNIIFNKHEMVVGPTHSIWSDIKKQLNGEISEKSLYTIVKCNRNNVLGRIHIKLLGSVSKDTGVEEAVMDFERYNLIDFETDNNSDNSTHNETDKINFKITLGKEEWAAMHCEKMYSLKNSRYLKRRYTILKPGTWTEIVHSHFWEQTKIACAIVYKRAKIYTSSFHYCVFYGNCKTCNSELKGTLDVKPPINNRAIFHCVYKGNYQKCLKKQKRRTPSEKKLLYTNKLVNEKVSASMLRRSEANDLMEFGDNEPSHLPTANALRITKCRAIKDQREDDDPILALCKLKHIHPYLNIIKDIGYDRFFVHYWSTLEINVYRQYSQQNKITTVCIDATGSLVKKPTLITNRKTKSILLYEIAVHDRNIMKQYSVSHMLSERHDNNSIYYWLIEWIRDGAPCPKQVITDMSLALMAAVVRAFTQYNNLKSYITTCFKLLTYAEGNLPTCFIRCDVAHVIKLVTTWKPLQVVDKRVKDFIIRSIAQMILSDDLEDIKQLLHSFFCLIFSKTDGCLENGMNTASEDARKFLRQRIATGVVEQYINDNSDDTVSQQNFENLTTFIDTESPFYEMTQNISKECQNRVNGENGDHDNLFFLPNVAPLVINLCTYLPLWSGIMCSSFKYGDIPPSSAPIESQFNDLKNRVLKHVSNMPMRIDDFLKLHIQSLNGTMKLVNSNMHQNRSSTYNISLQKENPQNILPLSQQREKSNRDTDFSQNPTTQPDTYEDDNSTDESVTSSSSNTFEDDTCIQKPKTLNNEYKKNVLLNNNFNVENETDTIRIDDDLIKNCSEDLDKAKQKSHHSIVRTTSDLHTIPLLDNEDYSEENWGNILMNPKKKTPIYLTPNREIMMRNLNTKAKTKSIGLIQNGNKTRFKSIKIGDTFYVLSNTCAFDSVIQLLAVAYCDSDEYGTYVKEKKNESTLWHLIFALLRDGLTVQTYRNRAIILKNIYPGEPTVNDVVYLSVEQAVDNLLIKLLNDDESIEIVQSCSSCGYKHIEKKQYLTVCVPERHLTKRQLDNLLSTEIKCQYYSTNCKSCSKEMVSSPKFGNHIFFNLINLNNTLDGQFTDTRLGLNHIPKSVKTFELPLYYLRGSVTTPDNQQNAFSHTMLGHYHAHTYRHPINIWQKYDDNAEKVHTINENAQVNVQILMYSK